MDFSSRSSEGVLLICPLSAILSHQGTSLECTVVTSTWVKSPSSPGT